MSDRDPSEITRLLERARQDRKGALGELLPLVQGELHRLAEVQMKRERNNHTLQPTALVNEAFVRLAGQPGLDWRDRAQFLAVAGHAMRQILVDHARVKLAKKRGGDRARVTLQEDLVESPERDIDLLDLNAKLEELREVHERQAQVVEMRFFGGLTFEESGHVLGISPRTVQADWHFARAWLQRALKAREAADGPENG